MRLLLSLTACIAFFSCSHKNNIPDVSGIKVDLKTYHFEKELYSLDTTGNIVPQLDLLIAKYPGFGENFMSVILKLDPRWSADTVSYYIKGFMAHYRTVYDSAEKTFADFSPYEAQLKRGLQFVKYYYPKYKIPTKIITYIGPADGYGDNIDDDAFYVGLHAHLGKDFPFYKTDEVADTYPEYVTARFTPDYIRVACLQNIVLDLYPERSEDKRLLIQMIEKGKRLYLLNKFLPETEEYMLIGYTKQQMKDAYAGEAKIWNLFIQNNYLQLSDNNLIKNYVTEGPTTQELGEGSPGNIGSFAGWQIVKKYMNKHSEITPDSLMKTDDEKLYEEAKYKP